MIIRDASESDLDALVRLLGQLNESPPAPTPVHRVAFAQIQADERQHLVVIEDEGALVASASMAVVPNMGRDGRPWAIIENVVVDEAVRSRGFGARIMQHLIERARGAGCYRVVLMSRKHRADAHRFYQRLGFEASSEGYRLALD